MIGVGGAAIDIACGFLGRAGATGVGAGGGKLIEGGGGSGFETAIGGVDGESSSSPRIASMSWSSAGGPKEGGGCSPAAKYSKSYLPVTASLNK